MIRLLVLQTNLQSHGIIFLQGQKADHGVDLVYKDLAKDAGDLYFWCVEYSIFFAFILLFPLICVSGEHL